MWDKKKTVLLSVRRVGSGAVLCLCYAVHTEARSHVPRVQYTVLSTLAGGKRNAFEKLNWTQSIHKT